MTTTLRCPRCGSVDLEALARLLTAQQAVRAEPALRVDLDHAAALLRISRRHLERRIAEGAIPTVQDGRSRFILRADLERYAAGLTADTLPEADVVQLFAPKRRAR